MSDIKRESFVFYRSFYESLSELTDESVAKAMRAICEYALNGVDPALSGIEKAVFVLIKPQIDAGIEVLEKHDQRRTVTYRQWRTAVFKRDGYVCQVCFKKGGKLNAHHIKSFSQNKQLRTTVSNGITLCEACHREYHKRNGKK